MDGEFLLSFNFATFVNYSIFRNLPAKAQTELNRRKGRDEAKEKAKEYLRAGRTEEAKREFAKSVDITHEHAIELMKKCRELGVDCITGMYEADAQLAYLNKIGVAEYVMSEDSDLILFGCKKIIFKLQLDGRCLLFDSEKLHLTIGTTEDKFSFEKFRRICILSGCDYLNSLHGIGLAKAKKFMMLTEETDMRKALLKIPVYLNMKKLTITDEYIEGFLKAEATFKHMFVYNPLRREMLRLNPIDEDDPEIGNCTNAGQMLEANVAYQLALGNINPRSFHEMDDFNPDAIQPSAKKRNSIWDQTSITSQFGSSHVKQQSNISSFFSVPTRKLKQLKEVQNIIDLENDVTSEIEIDDLMASYCVTDITSSKRRSPDLDDDDVPDSGVADVMTPVRNPFAKRHQSENKKVEASSPSLLKSISQQETAQSFAKLNHRVVSRFFTEKLSPSLEPKSQSSTEETNTASESQMKKINLVYQESLLKTQKFYASFKSNESEDECTTDEAIDISYSQTSQPESDKEAETFDSQQESEIVEIDLDHFEFKVKSQKQTFINVIKPKPIPKPTKSKIRTGLSSKSKTMSKNKTSQKSDDSIQTKLSKFGFQKKTTVTQLE